MRKKSIAVQLKEANNARVIAENALAEKEKALAHAKTMHDHYSKSASEANEQVNSVHAFLDALPTPPAKHPEGNSYQSYSLMTRIALWMAAKA